MHSSQAPRGVGTLAVHAGASLDPTTGAVIEPVSLPRMLDKTATDRQISLSTTFAQHLPGNPIGPFDYSRSGNPNRDNFEAAVAALEHGKHGIAFASGSAATSTILQALDTGSHVVSVSDVYGGTYRYFARVANTNGVQVSYSTRIEQELEDLIRPETKLVWVETPSNPTLSLVDIRVVVDIAHKHNITVVVDNTFASPVVQNPLDSGADLVVHSVTKFLNGHSDVVMGIAVTNSDSWAEKLHFLQNSIGAVPSPFDCWLAHRGLKTLHLRVRESSRNASLVAKALQDSPHVKLVNYPGLDSHPQRDVALKQHHKGLGGGMLSFRINGDKDTAARFCEQTQIFTLAESLGGIESLCEVPAVMTHASIPKEVREKSGVFDDLIRLSCGIEDGDDLVADVLAAIEKAVNPKTNGSG